MREKDQAGGAMLDLGECFTYVIRVLLIFRLCITSNLSLYLLYYAEAHNEFTGPISTSLRPGNTVPSKEMLQ